MGESKASEAGSGADAWSGEPNPHRVAQSALKEKGRGGDMGAEWDKQTHVKSSHW